MSSSTRATVVHPAWCTDHWTIYPGSEKHEHLIVLQEYWHPVLEKIDRTGIHITQYVGDRVTGRGSSWTSGRPLANALLADLDAKGCRKAAAALIEAAEIIEAASLADGTH